MQEATGLFRDGHLNCHRGTLALFRFYGQFAAYKLGALLHTGEAVKGADCLIIMTDHTEFKNLMLSEIETLMNAKAAIIDGKRIINPHKAEKLGFTYYGVGYCKQRSQN